MENLIARVCPVTTVGELFTPEANALAPNVFLTLDRDVQDAVVFNTQNLTAP